MSNPIKYSTGSESLALKKGNFYIGTGDVGKGPSDTTGFYQGVSPSAGGYVIYMNKSGAPGNLSYHNAPTDAELISFTNSLAGQSYTTVNQCLSYFAGQTDKVCVNRDYEGIVTNGLIMCFDTGFIPSYPKNGSSWYDVSTNTNLSTLSNSPTFSSDNGGILDFDGTDDYGAVPTTGAWGNNSLSITSACYPEFDVDQYGRPIFTKTDSCGNSLEWGLEYGRSNVPSGQPNKFSVLWGGNVLVESSSQFPKNNWYIVTINIETSNTTYSLYVNGTLDKSGTYGNSTGNGNGNFGIGRWDGCYPNVGPWNGKLGVIYFYNRALSGSESIQNYNAIKGRFGL